MKKAINITIILITFLMLMPCITWLYFITIGKDKIPSASSTVNVTTVTDPQTQELKQSFELNYYENANGKGKEVVEFIINSYSGIAKQALYSVGFQLVTEKGKNTMYYYDSHFGESFVSATPFEWGKPLYINIDDELYTLKMDGTRIYRTFNLGKSIWFGLSGIFTGWGNREERTTNEVEEKFTYLDVLIYLKAMAKSSSYGTGDSLIPMIDLGTYFSVYDYGDDSTQTSGTPIGGNGKNTFTRNFFSVQCHYDRRGMVFAEQSLFKSVEGDSDFNISGIDIDVKYWQMHSKLLLTEEDFEPRSNGIGNYYFLSNEAKNLIKNYTNVDVYIEFNVDELTSKVLGFDYLALTGIKIKQIKIISKENIDFEFLNDALKDTGLDTVDVICSNVNLIEKEVAA